MYKNIYKVYLLVLPFLGLSICYQIEKITKPLLLGEGPHWNTRNQILYFVDILDQTIHLYDPSTEQHNYTFIGNGPVSFIIPIEGKTNEFLVSTGLDIRHVIWNGETDGKVDSAILYSATQLSDGSRFNDAKVDRFGRLWAGTMGPEDQPDVINKRTGKLYSLSLYSGLKTHLTNILISNGLAWTIDESIMYYTDTGDNTIDSFDFNNTLSNPISNRQRVFNFTEQGIAGKTDGFTIDTNGNLWLACYGGYQVVAINPRTKKLLTSVRINASQVTSVNWGGKNLDELYVTTARKGLSNEELKQYPDSGATFKITGLGARGYPSDNYIMYN